MHGRCNLMDIFNELVSHYFELQPEAFRPVPFGLTNHSRIVDINNRSYIARIYDKSTKTIDRLRYEIELTAFLTQQQLSFDVPFFLRTINDSTYVELSNGQLGVMMLFIEGAAPDLERLLDVEEYGRVVGEVSVALQAYLPSAQSSSHISFNRVESLHPLANNNHVLQFLSKPPFFIAQQKLDKIIEIMNELKHIQPKLDQLPKQVVHHDLLLFNLLIDPETRKMNGVLDFDFASYDVRALEPAICITHLVQVNSQPLEAIAVFWSEYKRFMELTPVEIVYVPALIRLYYIALIYIYIGQAYSGREIEQYFLFIVDQLEHMEQWLGQHAHELESILKGEV